MLAPTRAPAEATQQSGEDRLPITRPLWLQSTAARVAARRVSGEEEIHHYARGQADFVLKAGRPRFFFFFFVLPNRLSKNLPTHGRPE